jgi:DNA invertase Pin-like site-specific DNA recombinase
VDRLGRSLQDLLGVLSELHAKRVDLYLHQQGLDTSTPSGRAMFLMMGVFAEFERAMIRERVLSGLTRARQDGITLGRPRLDQTDAAEVEAIRAVRAQDHGAVRTARQVRVGGRHRAAAHRRAAVGQKLSAANWQRGEGEGPPAIRWPKPPPGGAVHPGRNPSDWYTRIQKNSF